MSRVKRYSRSRSRSVDNDRRKRSRSPDDRRKRSRSPDDRRKRSRSPDDRRRRSRSPDERRKRSRSPDERRKRSRSRSVDRSRKSKRDRRSPSRDRDRDRDRRRSRSRDRRRSRSRDRRRSLSRERRRSSSRDRRRSRERRQKSRRSRSRSYEIRKKRKRSRSWSRDRKSKSPKEEKEGEMDLHDLLSDPLKMDKEEAERRLNAEMQKRRERIEKWRNEKKRKELELAKEEAEKEKQSATNGNSAAGKVWSLEDDDEEDEAKDEAAEQDENEVDPLDAFMVGINEEVRKVNKIEMPKSVKKTEKGPKRSFIIMGVAKNTVEKEKGLVMEQNQDALEYSSEEEGENITDTMASIATKGRKDLVKINHADMNYVPFRKNFYMDVPEIANMTKEEVDAFRLEMEGINVKGKGCPKPVKTWAQCGISRRILDILKKCSYEKPTPIQCQAIPAVMSGRDVIGIAKTGSGKTLAYLLPLLRHVMDQPDLDAEDGPISIVMTPTRELCMQIGKEAKKFVKNKLRVVCVYGGTSISEQIAELKRGAEIIVCTPGRMIDMLAANNGRVTNLRRVSFIVLDEADRMFDLGFEPQVMRIIDNIQPDKQTVMFSATFPRKVEALAKKILNQPIEIMVGGRSIVCKDVVQEVVILNDDEKFLKLLELLGTYYEQGQTIIFVESQESADSLFKDLIGHSYRALVLHGGVDQIDRDTTISDFKTGRIPILVATSVAARGLDVKQLILVVNFDVPNHYEDYVHRCGRTGRAGNKGYAYTFITPDQPRFACDIIRALELSETPVPEQLSTLWTDYKKKMEAEGKKVQGGGSFHGKGFKFDETEANYANEKKKFEKAALGLEDSDEEEDIEENIEQEILNMFNTKRIVKEINPNAPLQPTAITSAQTTNITSTVSTISNADKFKQAQQMAQMINKNKIIDPSSLAMSQPEFVMKGGLLQPTVSNKTVAEQLAQKLNNKLNYQPQACDEDIKEEVQHKYEEELEINEFPQQVRWRITSKEVLAQICEYSETGITVRGTYYPTGKAPPENERKLFLAIEAISDLSVSKAKAEIIRLIREELIKLKTAGNQAKSVGRYKVL